MSGLEREIEQARSALRAALRMLPATLPKDPVATLVAARDRGQQALERVDDALSRARAEVSARTIAARGAPSPRPPDRYGLLSLGAVVSSADAVIEWAAAEITLDAQGRRRYRVEECARHGQVRSDGALGRIARRNGLSLYIGGNVGAEILRVWPRTDRGGRVSLGAVGICRLVGGESAVDRARVRAWELGRIERKRRAREAVLDLVDDVRGPLGLDLSRKSHAVQSDEAFRAFFADLAAERNDPEIGQIPDRLAIVSGMFRAAGQANASGPARRAAIRSTAALQAQLQAWLGTRPPHGITRPQVFAAMAELSPRADRQGPR